jgi:isopentenyldiphosphate isomerase
MKEEYLDVLNEEGEMTGGTLSYKEVHQKGLIHLTARVWFVNSKGELLVQKRSLNKRIYPGLWDAGVGGHVSSGETSVEGAQKETREEIGLEIPAEEYKFLFRIRAPKKKYYEDLIDNEFNDIYVVYKDLEIDKLKLGKNEVDELRWIDVDTLEKWSKSEKKILADHTEEYKRLVEYFINNK